MAELSSPSTSQLSEDERARISDNQRRARRRQKALGRHGARFSHAMVCVGSGIWADATPESGEMIAAESAIFDSLAPGEFRILRRPSILPRARPKPSFKNALDALQHEISKQSAWFYDFFYFCYQRYDYLLGFSQYAASRTSFCSDLVEKIYARRAPGLLQAGRRNRIFPQDLFAMATDAKFDDITQAFSEGRRTFPSTTDKERVKHMLNVMEFRLGAALDNIAALEQGERIRVATSKMPGGDRLPQTPIGESFGPAEQLTWSTKAAAVAARKRVQKLKLRW
ncbi:hypothetical protein LRP31_09230 [Mesorhizobium mediterraneum]|nr:MULTISPECIES: hypothetical protein [Mesorhizobium]RUU97534.1 hypothetical protein EOB36_26650 [Mesorhizobium sp. M6A.T.Cr.TU.017.01.1.1]RWN28474.1 MAG: hypothetical protein EOR96_32735 [Mesorhizobium sp.]RWP41122.1 MAG: hypothetical protein EOR05_31850 [Mesorhizobium sp.]WIW55387.1 hypothetical protein LRP31_09230 [Mesorhizobium mediterraneum]